MARVKDSNCLNFCTQLDLSKTRKVVHFCSSNMFLFSPSRIDGSGHNRSKTEHFRSVRISKILHQGKSIQRLLFHRLFVIWKIRYKKMSVNKTSFSHHLPICRIPPNYVCKLPKEWSSKWRKVFFGQMFSRDAGNSSK